MSRNTVLAAYEQLRAEGFIESRAAVGNFVATTMWTGKPTATTTDRLEPQSRYARRARRLHDHANLPSHLIAGMRYRFDCSTLQTNPSLSNAWARELARAAIYTPLCNAPAQGLPALRAAICDYLARPRGVHAVPEDVLVVSGTQQAISLTARVLLDEGDDVAIEEPQYFAIRQVLQIHGAQLRGMPIDREGLCCDVLPDEAPRLVCVTPSHQFPTGAIMSLRRRKALLDYAVRHGCWIFEDDYDGEFRYEAKPMPALCSLEGGDRVIYTGTFSKALFPALRLAYIVMPSRLRQDFIAAKWLNDFGSPAIEQAALANFMANGGLERHMRRSTLALQERRAALIEGLRKHAGDRVEIEDSRAGMHLLVWLRGRSRQQGDALIARAHTLGLGIPSVAPEYIQPPDRAGLLFKFAGVSTQEIREAMPLFARCLDETAT